MRICLRGYRKNTVSEIAQIERSIEGLESAYLTLDQFLEEAKEEWNIPAIRQYIDALYDIVVGLCQGKTTVDEVREFFFNGIDMNTVKTVGDLIVFKGSEEATEATDKNG